MGKVALITGASSGIGAAIARVLSGGCVLLVSTVIVISSSPTLLCSTLGKGIHCVLVARRADKLEEVKQQILKEGGSASVYPCDTTDKNQVVYDTVKCIVLVVGT